jgi:hypothetical protein
MTGSGAKRTFSLLTILAEGTTIGDGWLAKNEMERILRTSILFQRDHDKGVLTIGIVAFADARPLSSVRRMQGDIPRNSWLTIDRLSIRENNKG